MEATWLHSGIDWIYPDLSNYTAAIRVDTPDYLLPLNDGTRSVKYISFAHTLNNYGMLKRRYWLWRIKHLSIIKRALRSVLGLLSDTLVSNNQMRQYKSEVECWVHRWHTRNTLDVFILFIELKYLVFLYSRLTLKCTHRSHFTWHPLDTRTTEAQSPSG